MSKSDLKPLWKECDPLELVYKYLKQAKKYDLPGTDSEKFSPTNIIRLRFENLVKMIMIKQNDRAFKLTFLNEKKLSEYQIKDLSFCFEDNTTSRKLIGGLLDMGYQKSDIFIEDKKTQQEFTTDSIFINSINDMEISQILFHEEDCYINGLSSLCKSYEMELVSPDILRTILLEQDNNSHTNPNFTKYPVDPNLKDIFNSLEADINEYFSCNKDVQVFLDSVGNKTRQIIPIMLNILGLKIESDTAKVIINEDQYKLEYNFVIQFKFTNLGFVEMFLRLLNVISNFKVSSIKNN